MKFMRRSIKFRQWEGAEGGGGGLKGRTDLPRDTTGPEESNCLSSEGGTNQKSLVISQGAGVGTLCPHPLWIRPC